MNTKRETDTVDVTSQRVAAGIRNPKLRRAVEEIVPRLIYPAERLHGVVEGVEALGLDQRATLGFDWPWISRVVLLITDRRLLELSVRPMGRRLEGRVRTFAWSMVRAISCDRRRLQLTSRNGASIEWAVRMPLAGAALGRLKDSAAPLGEAFASRVCDRCGSAAFSGGRICSGCNARVVDPREVASYGWTIPGAGLMMTRHPVLGAGRLILELVAALVFGWAVLSSGSALALGTAVVGAAIILPLIKLESVRIARLVAARSGVGMKWSGRPWDRLRAPVAVLAAALLAAPLFFAGSMNTRISADLDFIVPDQLWSPTPPNAVVTDPHLRSVWSHRDGWTVTVAAEALEPFAGFEDTHIRIEDDPGTDDEQVQIADFETFMVVDPAPIKDLPEHTTRLELHVFDRSGRDVHTLATQAPAAEISFRAAEIRNLLRHAIWTDPRDVSSSAD
jgi:hypothetical protein